MARIAVIGGGGGAAAPLDPDLDAIAALTPANDDVIQRKASAWTNRTPAQVKTDLALTKADVGLANADNTTDAAKPISTATQTALDAKQPLDSDLTAIAAIAPANDDVIQRKAGAWANRTVAQFRDDLYPTTTASGTKAHAEGVTTTASGNNSHAEGQSTTASSTNAHAEGQSTQATAQNAHAEGYSTRGNGYSSHAEGAYAFASRYAEHAKGSATFAGGGDAQQTTMTFAVSTAGNVATTLTADKNAVTLTPTAFANVLTIPVDRAHRFSLDVVARRSDVSGDAAGWEFKGLIVRGSSGNAAFAGTVQSQAWGTAGAAAWDVTLTIDTTDATNNYLKITVTGVTGQTIRWVATLTTTEVG